MFQHASVFDGDCRREAGRRCGDGGGAARRGDRASFCANGPTADELSRLVGVEARAAIFAGSKRSAASAARRSRWRRACCISNNSNFYKKRLGGLGALTPAAVQKAAKKWLSRPVYSLTVKPGERTLDGGKLGGWRRARRQLDVCARALSRSERGQMPLAPTDGGRPVEAAGCGFAGAPRLPGDRTREALERHRR